MVGSVYSSKTYLDFNPWDRCNICDSCIQVWESAWEPFPWTLSFASSSSPAWQACSRSASGGETFGWNTDENIWEIHLPRYEECKSEKYNFGERKNLRITLRITLSRIFSISSSLDSAFFKASTGSQLSSLSISLLNSRILSRVFSSAARSSPDNEHNPHLRRQSQEGEGLVFSVIFTF